MLPLLLLLMAYSFNNIIQKKEPADKARLEQCLDGCAPFDPAKVTTTRVDGTDAIELQNLLSVEECHRIIGACNDLGFTFWANAEAASRAEADAASEASPGESPAGAPEAATTAKAADASSRAFRSADTIEVDLPGLTATLWDRLRPHVPLRMTFDEAADPETYERDAEGTWEASGLSLNLLFARYGSGGHFAPHVDGTTIEHFNRRSLYTVLIYLNTVGGGGETLVMTGDQCAVLTKDDASGRIQGNGRNVVHRLVPVEGACVVFRYDVLHEGVAVDPGRVKYIIRGDVMFDRVPPILDAPADRQAFATYQQARIEEAEGRYDAAIAMFKRVRKLSPGIADVYQL